MKKTLLLLFTLLFAAGAWAQTNFYVATTGDDGTGDGSDVNPWATIQHAIDNSSGADIVINVAAGNYSEKITINKSLTLQGNGRDDDANASRLNTTAGQPDRYWMLEVADETSDVTIKNFRFEGDNSSSYFMDYAIRVNGDIGIDKVTVTENTFVESQMAVMFRGNVTNSSITSNLIDGLTNWWAISVISPTPEMSDILIKGNEIRNSTSIPIVAINYGQVSTPGNLTIEDNYIHNNDVSNPGEPGYIQNREGQSAGILVRYHWDNVTIENNVVENNLDMSGVGIWGVNAGSNITNLTIQGNTLKNNTGSDRMFGDLSGVNPDFLASGISIHMNINDKSTWTIENNIMTGNARELSYFGENLSTPAEVIDAQCNWWGTTTQSTIETLISVADKVDFSTVLLSDDIENPDCGAPTPNLVTNVNKSTTYTTIQDAIDAADPGDVIEVSAGNYSEYLSIDKSLTLKGPNFDKPGNDQSRGDEAVIQHPDGNYPRLIDVASDNVTISGFKIIDNGNITGPVVGIYAHANGTTIKNNYFTGFAVHGAVFLTAHYYDGSGWVLAYKTGAMVEGNYLKDGRASTIYLQGVAGTVQNNVVENSSGAIQIQPYANPTGGVVQNNTFNTYLSGIWHNVAHKGSGAWSYIGNTVTAATLPANPPSTTVPHWRGIVIQTHGTVATGDLPSVTFTNNTVNGSGASSSDPYWDSVRGIWFRPNIADDAPITFTNNTITNVEIGALRETGNTDLSQLLTNNTFPEGMVVFGNQIGYAPVANITQGLGYNTIQAAIDVADPGDVIEVAAGTYTEDINITKPLTLNGANADVAFPLTNRGPESIIQPVIYRNMSGRHDPASIPG